MSAPDWLDGIRWRRVAIAAVATANALGIALMAAAFVRSDVGFDWQLFVEAGARFSGGGLYEWGPDASYRYSPVLAWLFGVIAPIGYVGWSALHVAALAALPRRVGLIALVSFPFWNDVYNGNTTTFVFVAGYLALHGSRAGTVSFLALALLIPRPLMLPVIGWIMWRERRWLVAFAALFAIHGVAVWVTGWGADWIANLVQRGGDDFGALRDIGPARLIGSWWVPIGIALAAWLMARRRVGLASIAVSPYWLPHYLLMALLDVRKRE